MKVATFLAIIVSIFLSSCSRDYYATNSEKLPSFAQAKTFSFLETGFLSSENRKAIISEMARRNIGYTSTFDPDYLVGVIILKKNAKLADYYKNSDDNWVKTPHTTTGKTLVIQMIDNKTYFTVWRGYISLLSEGNVPLQQAHAVYSAINAR